MLSRGLLLRCDLTLPPDRQTDRCKNITFPKLRLRSVINNDCYVTVDHPSPSTIILKRDFLPNSIFRSQPQLDTHFSGQVRILSSGGFVDDDDDDDFVDDDDYLPRAEKPDGTVIQFTLSLQLNCIIK